MTKIKGSKVAPTGTLPAKRQVMSINSRRWYALAVVLAAVFLAAFDFNVVTIAIPSIQRGLGTSFGEIQLIVAEDALFFSAFLNTGGRLRELFLRPQDDVAWQASVPLPCAPCR